MEAVALTHGRWGSPLNADTLVLAQQSMLKHTLSVDPTHLTRTGQHMKLTLKTLVVASVVALASSLMLAAPPGDATDLGSQHTDASLLGSWSLDTSRMPVPPEQRPASVRFTLGDAGRNTWKVSVDIVYAPGQEVHSVSTPVLDGSSTVITNSPEADTGTFKQPAPNVLVMALQKQGVLVSTRIYSALPDGRTMVETAVYPGQSGTPVMKTNYFTRVR